jgi:hypothetical protein
MNDSGRFGRHLAKNVDMSHNIMTAFLFLDGRQVHLASVELLPWTSGIVRPEIKF